MDFLSYVVVSLGALCVGAIVGGLIVRNNYKHFKSAEKEVQDFVLDTKLSAEQKLVRIRRLFNI